MTFHFGTDSRTITEYRTSCSVDDKIMKDNGLKTPLEYRRFIQRNGNSILQINRDLAKKNAEDDISSRRT